MGKQISWTAQGYLLSVPATKLILKVVHCEMKIDNKDVNKAVNKATVLWSVRFVFAQRHLNYDTV